MAVVARRDQPRGFDAVHGRHPDVHQHDVRAGPLAEFHTEPTVLGVADDVDVGLSIEDHAEAITHQRLVVDDGDANGHDVPTIPCVAGADPGPSVVLLETTGRVARTA